MKNAELVLSELANRYELKHSSADSAEDISLMIAGHVDGLKPLALSEREESLVKQNREAQVDMLLSEGYITPGQQKTLKGSFSGDDLMLSEGEDSLSPADRAFSTMISVLRDGKKQTPDAERSGSQVLKLSEEDTDGDTANDPLGAMAQRHLDSEARKAGAV